MKHDRPLTLEQTLEAVHQAAADNDILDEVLAMKSEQVDAELAKAGVDVDALDARLAAREADIRKAQDVRPVTVSKRRSFSARVTSLLVAAATVIGGAGGYAIRAVTAATQVLPELTPAMASPGEALRHEAFEACGRGNWAECERKLDEAKERDPEHESDPDVQSARRLIAHH